MPPRRAKVTGSAAVNKGKKRPAAEDATPSDAPLAKKARQSASKAAPSKVVIEISSDEEEADDGGADPSQKKKTAASADEDSEDDSDAEGDESNGSEEGGEDEDGEPRLPRKVRERLEYIETHTQGLTSTYLKFITQDLNNYMGRGGSNADVAFAIANHCSIQAQLGRSDLAYERRLVKRVYSMCYGGCGESDNSDDEYDDDYEIPKEILNRLVFCLGMLEGFDLEGLRKVIKNLPKYKGRRKGELDDVLEDVMAHLDDLAAKKADIVAEAAMIQKLQKVKAA